MKTDVYTKVVLTVIAVCLAVIVVRDIDFVPSANAAKTPGDVMDVRIVGYSGYNNIPVVIKDIDSRSAIKVNIAGADWGFKLPVKIEDPLPLPVRMDR